MTATTEHEILSLLADNLKRAAEDCEHLAWHPRRGHIYLRFRAALTEVSGCCEQAFYWRGYDARWLALGELVAFVLARSGNWLRGSRILAPDGHAAMWTGGTPEHRKRAQPEFRWLANKLREVHYDMERIRDMATGKLGPILPPVLEGLHRDTRPVQVMTPGGIILPAKGLTA